VDLGEQHIVIDPSGRRLCGSDRFARSPAGLIGQSRCDLHPPVRPCNPQQLNPDALNIRMRIVYGLIVTAWRVIVRVGA
jgi:hypothetical protein